MEKDLARTGAFGKNYRDKFHLPKAPVRAYKADWQKEKDKWSLDGKQDIRTPPFVSDWKERTYSMKAKFRCPKCQKKEMDRGRENLKRNGYLIDESVPAGGWTTGCCTV